MKDFKNGDVVTIRKFDDMADEFGQKGYGYVAGPPGCYAFISDMEKYCGREFVINNAYSKPDITEPIYDLVDETGMLIHYFFHNWMFEEYKDGAEGVVIDDGILIDPAYQIDFLLT